MKKYLLVLCFGLAAALAACAPAVDLESPPEIRLGEDVCDECGMIISDPRYTAAYVTTGAEVRLFDDIGDMLVHHERQQEAVHVFWVHDADTKGWLRADRAAFVLSRDLVTPMGWGLAAYADHDAAAAAAQAGGGVVTTFAALQEDIHDGRLDPSALAGHDHESAGHEQAGHNEMDHDGMDHEPGELGDGAGS